MITILGGGGWFPAHGRETACALLRMGSTAIMIDAGTGVGRLVERPDLLEGVTQLDILLTHFHLDHLSGLASLPALGLCEQTTVWGPGKLLYDVPTQSLLAGISHEPFHPVPLEDQDIEVRDVPAGELALPGMRITTRRQDRHSAPTLAYRFNDTLAWITDTAYDADSARFAAGCKLLAHEAWYTEDAPRNPTIHSSGAEAAQVAVRAECEQLLLIHLPPFLPTIAHIVSEAQRVMPAAAAAADGSVVMALEPELAAPAGD